jgi:hypothetical protein
MRTATSAVLKRAVASCRLSSGIGSTPYGIAAKIGCRCRRVAPRHRKPYQNQRAHGRWAWVSGREAVAILSSAFLGSIAHSSRKGHPRPSPTRGRIRNERGT